VPGTRNYHRERTEHARIAPDLERHYASLLRTYVPDRALIGQAAIVAYFHHLGIRRLNRRPLSWRIVNGWRRRHGCPILRGNTHPLSKQPPLSTSHALTAWLLSRFTAHPCFSVAQQAERDYVSSFPESQGNLVIGSKVLRA